MKTMFKINISAIFLLIIFSSSLIIAKDDLDPDLVAAMNADEDMDIAEPAPGTERDDNDTGAPDGSDKIDTDESVLVLNIDNFDHAINKHPTILVEFYAPWCGHCKALAPEYAAAATELLENDPPIPLAKVDAAEQTELGQRFEIQGYPTLKFFKNGKDYDFDGERSKEGIVKFMKKVGDPKWEPEPESVVTLTTDNFDSYIEKESLMLVEFYAPWCGHCKRLAPLYEKAAKQLKENDPPVILAKVDATKESELGKRYNVDGYPTLKIFKNGRPIDYKGERDSEWDIIQAVQAYIGDGAKEIENLKLLKSLMPKDDIIIVGFFKTAEDEGVQAFKDLADELRNDYKWGISYDEASRKAYHLEAGSVVVFHAERFFTQYEPRLNVMAVHKDTKVLEIRKFVESHQLPLVGHYADDQIPRYSTRRPLCLVFYSVNFNFDHREATQMWRKKIAAIAKKYPDITFAIADDDSNAKLMDEFGLGETGEDMNLGIIGKNGKKYGMDSMEEFDSDEIEEFLNKFKKGKLQAHIKSQRPPKKQGPVKVVVGSTFEKIVTDPKKDVLIELYAPWCGHCKNLEPIYLSLAKKLKKEKNLVIAKMDATANDAPEDYSAEGFPTIYFSPAGSEKPLKYEGGRAVDDFVTYLKENAKASFKKSKDEL